MELARALRDLLALYRDPHLHRPTINMQKSSCQNLTMGQSYSCASQNIFAGWITFDFWPNMALSWAKSYVAAPGAGLAGKPMGAQA